MGEIPEGLPGSTKSVGLRGEKRQELGRPERFLTRGTGNTRAAQGIRIMSHARGNPATEVGRTLHAATVNPKPGDR